MPTTPKKSSAVIVTPQELSGSNTLDMYNEGVYINSVNLMFGTTVPKIRPNNDFLKVINGKRVIALEGPFNDLESPSSLVVSGTNSNGKTVYYLSQIHLDRNLESFVSPSQSTSEQFTGYNIAPSHFILRNDFGQPNTYQDGTAFTESALFPTGSLDPVYVIQTPFNERIYPSEIVNSTDSTSSDGVIDQLEVRNEVARSYTEIPYRFKGIKGDIGNTDTFLRSVVISENSPTVASRIDWTNRTLSGIEPYLDAGDEFGLDDLLGLPAESCGPVSGLGYVNDPVSRVKPFTDTTDDELSSLMLSGSSIVDAVLGLDTDYPSHSSLQLNEFSLSRGFDYIGSQYGFDSVAYGGLIKQ